MNAAASLVTDSNPTTRRCVLLSVGCDAYTNINNLASAESDAKSIFDALTIGPASIYLPDGSSLLLSPTKAEMEAALLETLKQHKGADAFAFYFAGHGIMQDGSFYLCPSDTDLEAISLSTINISTVLRVICELRPRQAYVIVDACYSGGTSLDLNTIIKPEILAQSPTFGLSVFASANLSKAAMENAKGGLFTQQLLGALKGTMTINDSMPFLGLGEIARGLPALKIDNLGDQAPNFWDLNLTGADIFCRNPAFAIEGKTHATEFGTLRYSQPMTPLAANITADIWRSFLNLPNYQSEELYSLFSRAISNLTKSGTALKAPSEAIATSFANGVEMHDDPFAKLEVRSAMVRAIFSELEMAPDAGNAIKSQLSAILEDVAGALTALSHQLDTESYCFLSRTGGHSDLYYLPLRIAQVLGWIGFLVDAQSRREIETLPLTTIRQLVGKVLKSYGNSIVAIGEDQAPFFLSFLMACYAHGWIDEAEEVLGRLYLDFNENFARVLVNNPSAVEIIDFLLLKAERPPYREAAFLQSPTELFSVILLGAALFKLDETIDPSLIQIDHTNFCFYVPDSYNEFWMTYMESGRSIVLQLGHGVWSINDFRRAWLTYVVELVEKAKSSIDSDILSAAHLMALALPDRLPLFIIPNITMLPDTKIRPHDTLPISD